MTIFLDEPGVCIRSMLPIDPAAFIQVFRSYGWGNEIQTYENHLAEQESGPRSCFVAVCGDSVAGYCTLIHQPQAGPWAGTDIPEISNLRVFDAF